MKKNQTHRADLKRARIRRVMVAAALFSGTVAHTAWAQTTTGDASAPDQAQVSALVEKAKLDFSAGQVHDALRGFRDAWALKKTPEIAANLAIVEAGFEHHLDAAEHFRFALSRLSAGATAQQRDAVAAGLEAEKRHVLTLKLQVAPMAAHILVDGQVSNGGPGVDEIYVEPGLHQIRAEAAGYQDITRSVEGAAGITVPVQFDLRPVEASRATTGADGTQPRGAPSPTIRDSHGPSAVPLIVGGALVFVGATVGTVYLLRASNDADEAALVRRSLNSNSACSAGTTMLVECNTLHDFITAHDRDRNIGVASFIVAGAAAAGGILYWVWPRDHAQSVLTTDAIVSPGYAAVRARWSW